MTLSEFIPCLVPSRSDSPLGRPSTIFPAPGDWLYKIQWTYGPKIECESVTVRAMLFVAGGRLLQDNSGDTLSPLQVNLRGISSFGLKLSLITLTVSRTRESIESRLHPESAATSNMAAQRETAF